MATARRQRETPAERRERRAHADDVDEVLDAAARFLEARSRSVTEVRRRLISAGYGAELVEQAVTRLSEQGYLDDEAFARAWVESRDRARPRGERALRSELLAKGIDRVTIDAVLEERAASAAGEGAVDEGTADESAARRLLERNRRALIAEADPRRRRQRAYALLARSGFDPDVCRDVAAAFAADVAAALGGQGEVAFAGQGEADDSQAS